MGSLNVVLILRSGGDFAFRDVDLLASRILQHYSEETKPSIYCYTNIIKGKSVLKNVTLLPHPNPEWTGWWSKMVLFSPELETLRPFLYLDLDTAVVKRLDSFLPPSRIDDFVMLRDFHAPTRPASGLMWIPAGSEKISLIWSSWIVNPSKHIAQHRGDQDFIRVTTKPDSFWQDLAKDKVLSFKPSRQQYLTTLPDSAEIVCFHGKPRPRQAMNVSWVAQYIENGKISKEEEFSTNEEKEDKFDSSEVRCWFSLLCPTRGRPEMARSFVNSVYQKAKWPEKVEVLLYVDSDDSSLPQYVKQMESTPARIVVGPPEGVGKAWNCLARASSGEYLMMANDDLSCESTEWDWLLLQELLKYPDQIVLVWANDGINGRRHCAFPIIGRRWYEALGSFVSERYCFFRHDTDLWETGKEIGMNRTIYVDRARILHLHHSTGKTAADETTWRNRRSGQNKKDEETYKSNASVVSRKNRAFCLRKTINESRHYHANEFEKLVKGKKVALVGPSPHLTHQGLGSLIDSYDVICRVNEILPIGLEKDYGSRSNILFYGCNKNNIINFRKTMTKLKAESSNSLENLQFFMASQRRYDSVNLFAMEEFLKTIYENAPHMTVGLVSLYCWSFWQRWVGTHPNTGILALLMLADAKPRELFLTGFSFYAQGLNPHQRHHSAYIEYGGDEDYNKILVKKGHDQSIQSAWFKEQFMSIYGSMIVLDSYLNDHLDLGHYRVVSLRKAR